METYTIPSRFLNTETKIFYYPSDVESNKVVLVLKGLYGEHDPSRGGESSSWDNTLTALLQKEYHVILIRSGRLPHETRMGKFEGKTFQEECGDIEDAVRYVQEYVVQQKSTWSVVANSFGGTTLLGIPAVLSSMETIIFINSGCGRSPTTTKPLVSTLPGTTQLLEPLQGYTGNFFFLNGVKDTVVPLESKKMIFGALQSATHKEWMDFPELDHELEDPQTKESKLPEIVTGLLLSRVVENKTDSVILS